MVREPSHLKNLVDYIKKNSQKGYSRDSLRWALIKQGNMKHEVDKAFEIAQSELARQNTAVQPKVEPNMEVITSNTPAAEEDKPSFWKRFFS